jgi:hypothetical protein
MDMTLQQAESHRLKNMQDDDPCYLASRTKSHCSVTELHEGRGFIITEGDYEGSPKGIDHYFYHTWLDLRDFLMGVGEYGPAEDFSLTDFMEDKW